MKNHALVYILKIFTNINPTCQHYILAFDFLLGVSILLFIRSFHLLGSLSHIYIESYLCFCYQPPKVSLLKFGNEVLMPNLGARIHLRKFSMLGTLLKMCSFSLNNLQTTMKILETYPLINW